MRKYRNTVTGAIILIQDEIKGKNWELVEAPSVSDEAPKRQRGLKNHELCNSAGHYRFRKSINCG